MIAFSVLSKKISGEGDIDCPCGEMFVDENGIKILVKGEERVLAQALPWDQAPKALAALRVMSEDGHEVELYEMIESKIKELGATWDDVEHFLGLGSANDPAGEGSLLGSIEDSWHLSMRCPWASLHNELERVRGMSKDDVARYTERALG